MRVFISWAGDKSKAYAEAFRNWLPGVLQFVTPYFTPADVEKGARWFTEISKEVEASQIGIFCVTPEALASTWMAFEAGAISKLVDKSKVCPVLFDVDVADIKGPLANFQATPFSKAEMRQLVDTINGAAGDAKLAAATLATVFDKWWPDLEAEMDRIRKTHAGESKKAGKRPDRELLEEVLLLLRRMNNEGPVASAWTEELLMRLYSECRREMSRARNSKDSEAAMKALSRLALIIENLAGPREFSRRHMGGPWEDFIRSRIIASPEQPEQKQSEGTSTDDV